jgi:hypothetical protein
MRGASTFIIGLLCKPVLGVSGANEDARVVDLPAKQNLFGSAGNVSCSDVISLCDCLPIGS